MKRSLSLLIAKMGVSAYTEQRIGKMSSAKRAINRWSLIGIISLDKDVKNILTMPTTKSLSMGERATITTILSTGRQYDAIEFMKSVVSFYTKKHRFQFGEDVTDKMTQPDISFACMSSVYESTVAHIESIHNFYFKSIVRSARGTQQRRGVRVGPFNRYVKDQWALRRDELRSICLEHKSTDVMRLLSGEWNADQGIRTKYMSEIQSATIPHVVQSLS